MIQKSTWVMVGALCLVMAGCSRAEPDTSADTAVSNGATSTTAASTTEFPWPAGAKPDITVAPIQPDELVRSYSVDCDSCKPNKSSYIVWADGRFERYNMVGDKVTGTLDEADLTLFKQRLAAEDFDLLRKEAARSCDKRSGGIVPVRFQFNTAKGTQVLILCGGSVITATINVAVGNAASKAAQSQ